MGAYNSEKITVSDTPIGFTETTINDGTGSKPLRAVFVVEDADIRFTLDRKVTPTADIGTPAEVGDIVTITGETDIEAFKAIRAGDTDATIQPHFFNNMDNDCC